MENNREDRGLRKSLATRQQTMLPSNFTFHTMQMIEKEIAMREKRHERALQWYLTLASISLPIICFATIYYFVNPNIILQFKEYMHNILCSIEITLPTTTLSLTILLLLFLDHWIRRQYYKKQYKDDVSK